MEQPFRARRSRPGRCGRIPALMVIAALSLTPLACGDGDDTAATDAELPQLADDGDSSSDGADATGEADAAGEADGEQLEPTEAALAFAQCMRDNGVPDFPDPEIDGDRIMQRAPETGAADGPAMEDAQAACEPIMAQAATGEAPSPEEQAEREEQALAIAQCIRDHGFPEFPDPEFENGRITQRLSADMGLDLDDPAFQEAQEECRPDGLIGESPDGGDSPADGDS